MNIFVVGVVIILAINIYALRDTRSEIEIIAEEVAGNHKYETGVYDCTNFSFELHDRLIEAGYNSSVVCGVYKDSVHQWIRVDDMYIDATNAEMVELNDSRYNEAGRMEEEGCMMPTSLLRSLRRGRG